MILKSKENSKNYRLTGLILSGLVLSLASFVFLAGTANVQAQTIIYDNGGLATGATSNSGVAAPAGTQWSEAQNNTGNTTESNTLAGVGCALTTTLFRCADDFVVPAGQTWTISNVITFAYQTGFAGTTSPITGGTLQIWNGRPGDPGSTVIFGDTSTNRLTSSTDEMLFRIFNSAVPPPGSTPGTTRRIWRNTLAVSPAQVLSAGTYWIDFQTQIGATTAHFAPPVTIPGTRGLPGWNARQFTGTAWQDVIDAGNPAAAPDVPLDFPFKLTGSVSSPPGNTRTRFDFDGDGKADVSVFRSSNNTWFVNGSTAGFSAFNFGSANDILVPADYDGDGRTDYAVFRPSNGTWYAQGSMAGFTAIPFGSSGDIPAPGDFDGDGKSDQAVFRPSNGTWYINGSMAGFSAVPFGSNGDKPVNGDYDGDGKSDVAVFRSSNNTWYIQGSTAGFSAFAFGSSGDKLVPANYDGDMRTDIAVFRPSNGTWYIQGSTAGFSAVPFGLGTDIAAPADFDGDGKADQAVFRSSNGTWYINRSMSGFAAVPFGSTGDTPIPSVYVR